MADDNNNNFLDRGLVGAGDTGTREGSKGGDPGGPALRPPTGIGPLGISNDRSGQVTFGGETVTGVAPPLGTAPRIQKISMTGSGSAGGTLSGPATGLDSNPPAGSSSGTDFKKPYPGVSVANGDVHQIGPDDAWAQANPGPWSGTGIANNGQVDQYGNIYVPVDNSLWKWGDGPVKGLPSSSAGQQDSQLWGGDTSDSAPDWFKKIVDEAAAMPDGPEKQKRIAHIMSSLKTPGLGANEHDAAYANAVFGFDGSVDAKDQTVLNEVAGGTNPFAPQNSGENFSPPPPIGSGNHQS